MIKLAPAERIDLLIDFSGYRGGHLTLYNTANAPFDDASDNQIDPSNAAQSDDAFRYNVMVAFSEVLRFDVCDEPPLPGKAPATLSKRFQLADETAPDLQDPAPTAA